VHQTVNRLSWGLLESKPGIVSQFLPKSALLDQFRRPTQKRNLGSSERGRSQGTPVPWGKGISRAATIC
jgi:hypothetical protein